MSWTREELDTLNTLRKEQSARFVREAEAWQAAGLGFVEEGTEYVIEYRKGNDTTWYSTSPFYDPLSLHPGHATDKTEALLVAAMLLRGERATQKGRDPQRDNVREVRIIERTNSAKIIDVIGHGGG
jgi:hypothetical protein